MLTLPIANPPMGGWRWQWQWPLPNCKNEKWQCILLRFSRVFIDIQRAGVAIMGWKRPIAACHVAIGNMAGDLTTGFSIVPFPVSNDLPFVPPVRFIAVKSSWADVYLF